MAVTVKGLIVKTRKDVNHREGMTVEQALGEAKVEVPHGGTVCVYQMDGRNVVGDRQVPLGELATAVVANNETVVVTPPVSNG